MTFILRVSTAVLVATSAFAASIAVVEAKSTSRCIASDDADAMDYDCQVPAAKDGSPCYCIIDGGRKLKGTVNN
jgi:hypothetical protein